MLIVMIPLKLKKHWLIASLSLFTLQGMTYAASDNFWEEDVWTSDTRGFLYYGPEEKDDKRKDRKLSQITTLKDLQREAQARLARAVMSPSKETLSSYLEVNHFMLEKSNTFAKTWQQTLWGLPQFDQTVTFPNANFAQVALKENKAKEKQSRLSALKNRYALLFVVQEGCSFCDVMAPVSRFLEETHGIKTLPIYIGNAQPASWPNALPDNGILRQLSEKTQTTITQTPAIFVVAQSGEARLIASGALAADELINRFLDSIKSN